MVSLSALREIEQANRGRRCAEHPGRRLTVVEVNGEAYPRCGDCHGPPERYLEVESPSQRYRRGRALPAAVRTHVEHMTGRWEDMTTETKDLALIQPTEAQLEEVGEDWSKDIEGFGALKRIDKILAAQLYMAGFQRFHIVIQHGHVGLSIDGWVWWAERAGGAAYGGYDVVPMTKDEHEAWGLEADEVGAKCTVYRLVQRQRIPIASDIGRAGGVRDKSQPVAKTNKAEMAIKRAVARTFRKAYPLGIDVATVISEHELLDPRGDFVTVEGHGREIDAPARVLPGITSAPPETESAEAGADTPAAAAPEPPGRPGNTPPRG